MGNVNTCALPLQKKKKNEFEIWHWHGGYFKDTNSI